MNEPKQFSGINFHTEAEEYVLELLSSDIDGISEEEAEKRIKAYGRNALDEEKKKSLLRRFIEQFNNIMVIILLIAAVISGLMGEFTDTFIILVVVIINAVLGVIQENKADKALEDLKKMSSPFARVKRNGEIRQIKTEMIVPGDIILLEAGDIIPADMRLLHSSSLKIEEAALTGESAPVEKSIQTLETLDLVIGDRKNMAYAGCSVTYGRGTGIIVATGMHTEVGKIARHLTETEIRETPLQKKLGEMSKYLTFGIIGVSVVIFIAGVLQGREYFEMFLTAISLAVAAIPEGLPAVITIMLALGVQKMAKRNAIIRKLSAVETLGSTEIICSDKTGTLTQNKMTVKEIYIDDKVFDTDEIDGKSEDFEIFTHALVLCNDTKVSGVDKEHSGLLGDPTETALVSFAANQGYFKPVIDNLIPRVEEIPFDSARKLMTTIHKINGRFRIITKGAPDVLIEKCTGVYINGEELIMSENWRDRILSANKTMAGKALRVLAVAIRDVDVLPDEVNAERIEDNLAFVGLVGMIDPPRPEVKEAIRVCKAAGIRPIMITGDHRDTATAIAFELDLIKSDEEVITGRELNSISDEEFDTLVTRYSVYARVSPEHKVRIVKSWKKKGKIVAMTGDGVNDAPAMKSSDIGIGMGITGTEVTKGVSNMVLADDNFATIVIAVEEGRKIYSNMRKTIQFLLSSNLGEVVTLFIATMLNWTVLLPIHILWVNLVTDTLPALALGMEKAEKDVMNQKPRKANSTFFSDGVGFSIVYQGVFKGLITLFTFYLGMRFYSHEIAITMAFATLGLIQLAHSFNVRSYSKSLFKIGIFSNMYLNIAIAISAILQLLVIAVPFLNSIFKVTPLGWEQWAIVLLAALAIIPIVEVAKLIQNKISRNKHGIL
jgi:Ca2+-transporting ATPase